MKKQLLTIIKNLLELDSDIDSENSSETGYVVIQMPIEEFEFIRSALKL